MGNCLIDAVGFSSPGSKVRWIGVAWLLLITEHKLLNCTPFCTETG